MFSFVFPNGMTTILTVLIVLTGPSLNSLYTKIGRVHIKRQKVSGASVTLSAKTDKTFQNRQFRQAKKSHGNFF